MQSLKRIPNGTVIGTIPLEAYKLYPTRLWQDLHREIRIAYADRNTHNENVNLTLKILPNGAKTSPYPQLVCYGEGPYHIENWGYTQSNPWNWKTSFEFHINSLEIYRLQKLLIDAKIALEAL
jgi:hypothetical protein